MTNSVRPHEHGCPCDACDRYEAAHDIAVDDAIQQVAGDCEGSELIESLVDGLLHLRQHLDANPITDRVAAGMVAEVMTRAQACVDRVEKLAERQMRGGQIARSAPAPLVNGLPAWANRGAA